MSRITTEQKVSITVEPKTATGKPAKADGGCTFSSSNDSIAKVVATGAFSADV